MSTIDQAFTQQYSGNVYVQAQQKKSRLKEAVTVQYIKGEFAWIDRLAPTAAVLRTTRHADTPLVNSIHSKRRLDMAEYEWADLIDDQDKVKMLIDPTSSYVQNAASAMGRSMDDVIIAALYGSATVKDLSGVSLPAAQKIVPTTGTVPSDFNMNTLIALKQKFDAKEVDPSEDKFIALGSAQMANLLGDTKVTSSDYASVKALVRGEIDMFMGFKFIQTERLLKGAAPTFQQTTGIVGAGANEMTNSRLCLAWVKSGVALGIGMEPKGRISERDDKSYATQVYSAMMLGAVRLEEEKVIGIYCKESDSVVS